jgi:hypothetical protein
LSQVPVYDAFARAASHDRSAAAKSQPSPKQQLVSALCDGTNTKGLPLHLDLSHCRQPGMTAYFAWKN